MGIVSSLEEIKEFEKDYKIVPVAKEILSDMVTPIEVLRRLKKESKRTYILESVVSQAYWGRYTFLGYDPVLNIELKNGIMTKTDLISNKKETFQVGKNKEVEKPNEVIAEVLKDYTSPKIPGLPSFTGGLVGYFAYDYIKYAEPVLKLKNAEEDDFSDMNLMLFDKVIAFDNIMQKLLLIVNIKTDNINENYVAALAELDHMEKLITTGEKLNVPKGRLLSDFKPAFSKEEYSEMVEKGKKYIYEGDIFQVVLSNKLEAEYAGSLFDTYRILRASNPSPYMFYFDMDGEEIAGASPETLTKLDDGDIYTFPLAGTRKRGRTPAEDKIIEEGLLCDEKELAEHNMLVDLGRNDLGRVAEFGTVEVVDYMSVEKYSHVMHIGSTVKGRLDTKKYDSLDVIASILPAGTLSGAPKIRACQIIDELEGDRRGVYGGAIGYIDFTGNMNTCIAIRLAFKKNGRLTVRSGAGIVADSFPANEYQECLNKAGAVIEAIKAANEL